MENSKLLKTVRRFVLTFFYVKNDGRDEAILVADEKITYVSLSSVYSCTVSTSRIRIVLFLAGLNSLESWGTDVDNAYLEALTKEKVCRVAGTEFGPLESHNLIIIKALYALRNFGSRWHERLADCLLCIGF